MSHQAAKCNCGRMIHLPKSAGLGHEWKCLACGHVWRVANHGQPTHNQRSKPPEDGHRVTTESSGGVSFDWSWLPLIIVGAVILYFLAPAIGSLLSKLATALSIVIHLALLAFAIYVFGLFTKK